MASYEKGKYSYNGNTIFFNEAEYNNAITAIKSVGDEVANYCGKVRNADKCFDSVPARYASLIPSPRFGEIAIGILDDIVSAKQDVLTSMGQTVAAIRDYCDGGGFSEDSQKLLDGLLSSLSPPTAPKGGGGGGGGGGAGGSGSETDENLTPEEDAAENIPSTVPVDDSTTTNDEEIVLGEIAGINGQYNSEAVVPFADNDESLEAGETVAEGNSSDFGTSLFGNSSFSVPSMLGSTDKIDGIKGAGVLGAAGVVAAAAAAIGGKVFYDKKHSDEEDDDEFDDDIVKMNEESGSDVNSGFMSGLNSVDFKSELLNESEGDE